MSAFRIVDNLWGLGIAVFAMNSGSIFTEDLPPKHFETKSSCSIFPSIKSWMTMSLCHSVLHFFPHLSSLHRFTCRPHRHGRLSLATSNITVDRGVDPSWLLAGWLLEAYNKQSHPGTRCRANNYCKLSKIRFQEASEFHWM